MAAIGRRIVITCARAVDKRWRPVTKKEVVRLHYWGGGGEGKGLELGSSRQASKLSTWQPLELI